MPDTINSVADHTDNGVVPVIIHGKARKSPGGVTFPVLNAAQDRVVRHAESADAATAVEAVEGIAKVFATWKAQSAMFRRRVIFQAKENFKRHGQEIIDSLMEETSCTQAWGEANIASTISVLDEVACSITTVSGEIPDNEDTSKLSLVFQVPVGPVLAIAPWNGGIVLPARAISQPLAAGCTVLFKASELCPRTHHLVAKMFTETGLPLGALNVLQVRREDAAAVTETMIAHPAIRKIDFIGSAAVGRVIGQLAAKHLKPILMELGGKCPAIILDDADLEDAALKCVLGAFMHHGQICFSTERIIVLESVAGKFVAELEKKAPLWQAVDGVNERMVANACALLEDAKDKGATFLIGGPDRLRRSALQPTILTSITNDMSIRDTESFGPSASLYVVKDEEEAIKLANDSTYGLSAAIHTKDVGRALRVGRRIECAQVRINEMTVGDIATNPIGGMKDSGWGRSNNKWGLAEFLQTQTILLPVETSQIGTVTV